MHRRRFLTGAATASALLAGCTSSGSGGDGNASVAGENESTSVASETSTAPVTTTGSAASGTATDAGAENGTETGTQSGTEAGSSYSVSIAPMGEVTFDGVPETWVANNGSWADMGVALGIEPPKAVWLPERYHTQHYDEVPGISVDKSGMQALYSDGVSKEVFYELDGDVHVIDPNFLLNRYKGWEQADVDELRTNVGPFFGNSIFSRGYPWHEDYQYYTLYEAFGKLAKLFQREDRYEQFVTLHDEMQSNLSDVVPSKERERPSVAILWASGNEPETFSPYLIGEGTSFKQWRDLGVRDALAETDVENFHATRSEVDFETLLEIDPEVLLFRGHESQTAEEFRSTVVQFMNEHSTASALTAVENDDVYRGGPLYQGPITNFVMTQRAAEQVYPDRVSGQLYDPERIAPIVNGNGES
ncbi:ABC transporter substrate-binding protein [Halococcus agarilyticus]|uniref:ABC transporter substrate-binding protein n=1 Tax=Halococcus agarilyticus TaxID=1232219 RepID=UPI0009AE3BEB|nr:ABC transporter substrate-binding protein [Halococcus agarilyticus]